AINAGAVVLRGPEAAFAEEEERTKVKSKWEGNYRDPLHPGCERKLVTSFNGLSGKLLGVDNEDGDSCPVSGAKLKKRSA
ncbi:unnamed protein product, partial [Prorocentrum cordatum]